MKNTVKNIMINKGKRPLFLCLMLVLLLLMFQYGEIENREPLKATEVEATVDSEKAGPRGVKLDANMSDYATIEDLPFDALDEGGERDGYQRMTQNEPIEFKTKLNDGRGYYMAFGALTNYRKIDDINPGTESGKPGLTSYRDHLYVDLPAEGMANTSVRNLAIKYNNEGKPVDDGNTSDPGRIPLLGPQVAVKPKPLNPTDKSQTWATYSYRDGMGMGAYDSGFSIAIDKPQYLHADVPMIVKMYRKGESIIAYGVSFDSKTRQIDGYYKVKLEPIGTKGRVRNTVKYLNATSKDNQTAMAYGIHVDIQNAHTNSKLYSSGNDEGLYFFQEKISDNQPYYLKFHMTGYGGGPEAQFANNDYNKSPWDKVKASFTQPTTPAEPGRDVMYNLNHPVVAYRWPLRELKAGNTQEWVLEQSVTSADAKAPVINKTVENLTTNEVSNTNIEDEMKYSTVIDFPTTVTDGVLQEVLPKEVSKPKDIVLDLHPNGVSTPISLDVADVYDETTHKITLPKQDYLTEKATLTYQVTVLPTAEDKTIINQSLFNGTDFDGDKLKELSEEHELKVKPIPYGELLVSYVDENKKEIAPPKPIREIIGSKFDEKPLKINGYDHIDTVGKVTGTITKDPQTLTFIYKEHRFDLNQAVTKLDGDKADDINVSEEVIYTTTLNSLLTAETPKVFYRDFRISVPLDNELEGVSKMDLNAAGKPVGTVTYDDQKREVVAVLEEGAAVEHTTDLVLTYHANVKATTTAGSVVKAQATAGGKYTDDSIASKVLSNEVASTVYEGALSIASVPTAINFASDFKVSSTTQRINNPEKVTGDLVVEDSRWHKADWKMTARLKKELTSTVDHSQTIEGALRYVYNGKEIVLTKTAEMIYLSDKKTASYKINSTWSETGDGLKLETTPGLVKRAGEYSATIEWELRDAP